AISLKGDYALGYYHLGLILAARNHLDEASQAYAKSLKFEKNNAYKQDTQGKIKELEKLIVRHESPGAGGNSAFPLGNYHSVDAVRRDAITALIASGQYAKAESQLKPLVSDEFRRDPSAWNNYGFALMKQHQEGKDQESLVALNKAIELSSGNLIEAHYNLAQILRRRGDFYGAERACVKAMGLAAKQEKLCPLVHNLYGILLKRSGRLEEADRAYSLAIAQSMDKLPVAHYNRAIVLEKRNKTREAVVEYQNYLKKSPSGANAERARRRLKRLGK
ncbi:MAG: hypothetical protein K8F91_03615, partial [Candidatus Obscuribacterales bacterium]|nr:hypothetical protein [Candidatus Obscuribacterales bacterium]